MAENFDQIVESVREGRGMPDGLSPMAELPSCLRGAFRAPLGFKFVAADLSQIELRVLAWLTRCQPMLDVFASGLDPYIDFATHMYNVPYDEVTKQQRQIAKPAVLSCGYGSSGGREVEDKNGDIVKTGLWGYAESMGVKMEQREAQNYVDIYRRSYPEVPRFWYDSQDALQGLLMNPEHGVTWFDRIRVQLVPNKLLKVTLPSGRSLHYLKPRLSPTGFNGRMEIVFDSELPGMGKTRGWRRLYGSLFTENLVQAIARDVMAVGMVRAHEAGFSIVGHTHDELVCLESLDSQHNLTYLNNMMTDEISWCNDLPLKSEGWEGEVYKK